MSARVGDTHPSTAPAWAQWVSTAFEPANVVSVTVVAMGIAAALPQHGIGVAIAYGAAALLLCALIPAGLVHALAKRGVLESRWVRPRAQRFVTMAGVVVLEVSAVGVLFLLGAPDLLIAMLSACVVGVIALTTVTPWVRASIHVGALSVIAGVMTQVIPPLTVGLLVLAAVVGAARLAQREHQPIEVVTGFAWGFAVGPLAAWPLLG
jgi:hypothetical protein